MCGIVGYIGEKQALPIVIKGLERLEYRGYDSAGVLIYDKQKKEVYFEKQPGRIKNLIRMIDPDTPGTLGIGHSRWASHGQVNKANAHPHWDCQKKIFVVHNGIIENFQAIKDGLVKKGHRFRSETDTEVVPHLIEEFLKQGIEYKNAIRQTLKTIKGSFALLIFNADYPQVLAGARFSGPLILGKGDNEFIFASDPTPISLLTKNVVYLDDGEMAFIENNDYVVESFMGNAVAAKKGVIDFEIKEADKGDFPNFMLKEIYDESRAVQDTLRGRLIIEEGNVKLGGLDQIADKLKEIDNILITGCGTAFYAAKLAEYFFEEYAQIPTKADLASELRYRMPFLSPKTLLVSVSQSGETADTLAVIKELKSKGILTVGVTNVVGSSIARMVDAGIYSHAGSELAVASTKAFLAQIADLILLMVFLARQRQMPLATGKKILQESAKIPKKIEKILVQAPNIEKLAKKYTGCKNFLYLGRKYSFPVALEGALKLKEIAYVHAEGLPAGENKHGPIALIDKNFASVILVPKDNVYQKSLSNLREIKARNGKVLAIATKGDKEIARIADDVIYIPKTLEMLTPLLAVVPLHLFAYYFAKILGRDIDRPRNLAKSVTVE